MMEPEIINNSFLIASNYVCNNTTDNELKISHFIKGNNNPSLIILLTEGVSA